MHDAHPLRYCSDYETPEPEERQTADEIARTTRRIQQTTHTDGHGALRAVHAKSHGLLQGELEVLPDLPQTLAQGLFATPGRYRCVMRLSTIPGDVLDDSVSVPRGLAIKVFGVPGERLPGSEDATTQDFIFVNGAQFSAPNGKGFAKGLKLLAATTDKAEGLKKLLSTVMRGAEHIVERVAGPSPVLLSLGGQPMTHLLGDTYYSQTPFLYGDYMSKFALAPSSPELIALTGQALPDGARPQALREAVVAFFARSGAEWELRVQLCTDLDAMPIENAVTPWPEDRSPYHAVARVRVPPQPGWTEQRSRLVDDGLAFSPWHGLAAHRPLGSINRMRRLAYEHAREFRAAHNGCPLHEPRTLDLPE